jgi:hypothetical protein
MHTSSTCGYGRADASLRDAGDAESTYAQSRTYLKNAQTLDSIYTIHRIHRMKDRPEKRFLSSFALLHDLRGEIKYNRHMKESAARSCTSTLLQLLVFDSRVRSSSRSSRA